MLTAVLVTYRAPELATTGVEAPADAAGAPGAPTAGGAGGALPAPFEPDDPVLPLDGVVVLP